MSYIEEVHIPSVIMTIIEESEADDDEYENSFHSNGSGHENDDGQFEEDLNMSELNQTVVTKLDSDVDSEGDKNDDSGTEKDMEQNNKGVDLFNYDDDDDDFRSLKERVIV